MPIIFQAIQMRAEWKRYFDGTDGKVILDSKGNLLGELLPWELRTQQEQEVFLRAMRRNAIKAVELLAGLKEGLRRMGNPRDKELDKIFTLQRTAKFAMAFRHELTRQSINPRNVKHRLEAEELAFYVVHTVKEKEDIPKNLLVRLLMDTHFFAEMDRLVDERLEGRGVTRENLRGLYDFKDEMKAAKERVLAEEKEARRAYHVESQR